MKDEFAVQARELLERMLERRQFGMSQVCTIDYQGESLELTMTKTEQEAAMSFVK